MIKTVRLILLLVLSFNFFPCYSEENIKNLSYEELLELSNSFNPSAELLVKLENYLNTPIVKNQFENNLNTLQLAQWNIENTKKLDELINTLSNIEKYKSNHILFEELNSFLSSDIIFLNEVSIGNPETNYENQIEKLASALKMNYSFGIEFIELNEENFKFKNLSKEEKEKLTLEDLIKYENLKNQYRGLTGSAILSKYPIVSSKIVRLPECYSWFLQEKEKKDQTLAKPRRGGRMALQCEVLLSNNKKFTVVVTELESWTQPKCRQEQFKHLLSKLREINTPLILGGSFFTTGQDLSPYFVKKQIKSRIKDPDFYVRSTVVFLYNIGSAYTLAVDGINKIRKHNDPSGINVPVVLKNTERAFFNLLNDFKFADGISFDINLGKESGYLGNSNEREKKGFKSTFYVKNPFGILGYKADWFFVKPIIEDEKFIFIPQYGKTLDNINKYFKISNHNPIVLGTHVHPI